MKRWTQTYYGAFWCFSRQQGGRFSGFAKPGVSTLFQSHRTHSRSVALLLYCWSLMKMLNKRGLTQLVYSELMQECGCTITKEPIIVYLNFLWCNAKMCQWTADMQLEFANTPRLGFPTWDICTPTRSIFAYLKGWICCISATKLTLRHKNGIYLHCSKNLEVLLKIRGYLLFYSAFSS